MVVEFILTSNMRVLINVVEIEYYEQGIAGMKVHLRSGAVLETTTDYNAFAQSFRANKK